MPRHRVRRRLALLMAGGFVLALAGSLAACGGSSGDDPPPVAPAEQPAAAATTPAAETVPASAATPELSVAPVEPPAEGETAPIATVTPESPAASAETPVLDPSTPPAGATETAATSTFRYDSYDLSGTVGEPGHYAFLADPNDPTSAVTTYEELRDGTTTALLIHTHDAHGVSQAGIYDAVAPGDLFEWSQAYDCFVRYQVMEVKPDPGSPEPRTLLAVAWMTYAFAGCSGPIAAGTTATFEWGDLPNLVGSSLTTPIQHGPFQLVPEEWTETVEPGAGARFAGRRFKSLFQRRDPHRWPGRGWAAPLLARPAPAPRLVPHSRHCRTRRDGLWVLPVVASFSPGNQRPHRLRVPIRGL